MKNKLEAPNIKIEDASPRPLTFMTKRRSMELIDNTRDTLMENFKNNPKLNKFKDKIDEIEPIISRSILFYLQFLGKMSVAPLDEAFKSEKLNDAIFNKPPSRASSKRSTIDNLNKQLDNKIEFLKPANQRRKKYSTSNIRTSEVDKKTKKNLEQAKVMSIIVKNNLNKGKFTYMLNKLPLTKGVSKIMDLLYPKKYK